MSPSGEEIMKKTILSIISLCFLLVLPVQLAYAQIDDDSDCSESLYENEFSCEEEDISNYCDSQLAISQFNIYTSAYCDVTRENDDALYEIIADQMNFQDADLVKIIHLSQFDKRSINKYLGKNEKGNVDLSPLPLKVQIAYDENNIGETSIIYERINNLYEKEKLTYQMKERLKHRFEASEKWANATLLDSPFDLIVDLNLIEVVLFGSRATWTSDVYSFPEKKEEDESNDKESTTEEEEGGDGQDNQLDDEDDEEDSTEEIDLECVPDDQFSETDETSSDCDDRIEDCDDSDNLLLDIVGAGTIGAPLMCSDPDAITLTPFQATSTGQGLTGNDDTGEGINGDSDKPPLDCPEGTHPRKRSDESSDDDDKKSSDYSPNVGGRFKKYPLSKKPPCPPGTSELKVDYADPTEGVTDSADLEGQEAPFTDMEIPRCLPTKFCASFDDARNFLCGEDWEKDKAKAKMCYAIESLLCVDVKTANRPETPYEVNEGCIDCHIRAMVDELDKLLDYNVVPLQNTMSAFAISNRWGPKFTFNLSTMSLGKIKVKQNPSSTPTAKAKQKISDSQKGNAGLIDPNKKRSKPSVSQETKEVTDIIDEYNRMTEKEKVNFHQDLKNYRISSGAITDQEQWSRVKPLLVQLKHGFENLQEVYGGLALGTHFHEKNICK